MNYFIRPATVADRPSCMAIAKMYRDTKSFLTPWYSGEDLFLRGDVIWVADQMGVAGFYSARFLARNYTVRLEYIAVAVPGYGVGTELIEHLQWRVWLAGTHHVIDCKVNDRSNTFWQRNKFELLDGRATWLI